MASCVVDPRALVSASLEWIVHDRRATSRDPQPGVDERGVLRSDTSHDLKNLPIALDQGMGTPCRARHLIGGLGGPSARYLRYVAGAKTIK